MNKKTRKNKKAISELISYVLLITIAIAMAGGVYAYLKFLAEKPLPEPGCEGISVAIVDYSCDDNRIYLTLENTGLHSVSVKVRLYDDEGRIIGEDIYKINEAIRELDVTGDGKIVEMSIAYDESVKAIGVIPFQIIPGEGQKFCPEAEVKQQVEGCEHYDT